MFFIYFSKIHSVWKLLIFLPDSIYTCVSQKNLVFYVLPTCWAYESYTCLHSYSVMYFYIFTFYLFYFLYTHNILLNIISTNVMHTFLFSALSLVGSPFILPPYRHQTNKPKMNNLKRTLGVEYLDWGLWCNIKRLSDVERPRSRWKCAFCSF
jgi:hypothetical protein